MEFGIRHINSKNSIEMIEKDFDKFLNKYDLPLFKNEYGSEFTVYNGFLIQSIEHYD